MIVKILSSTGTFNGVQYNTNKMDRQTGQLMQIKNFGMLEKAFNLTPEEVKNYLKNFSASNKRVKSPQLHATISCKGREYSKEQLSDIAEEWLKRMGYGENPYIIVHHSDTQNNHVHIVSSRIDKEGKKINDRFEGVRAKKQLDEILNTGLDKKTEIDAKIKKIESYSVSTLSQFKLLYEKENFTTQEKDGSLDVYNSGNLAKSYTPGDIEKIIGGFSKDDKRIAQIRAIITKYKTGTDNSLVCEFSKLPGGRNGTLTGYHSDLTQLLKDKFGLEFVFHFKGDKPPYGYTIIDHKDKIVFKGSEIMKLGLLIGDTPPMKISRTDEKAALANRYNVENVDHVRLLSKFYKIPQYKIHPSEKVLDEQTKEYYKKMLDYYLKYNSISNLDRLNIILVKESGHFYLLDHGSMNVLKAEDVLSPSCMNEIKNTHNFSQEPNQHLDHGHFNLNFFTSDVDDAKVHGRERRKKRDQ